MAIPSGAIQLGYGSDGKEGFADHDSVLRGALMDTLLPKGEKIERKGTGHQRPEIATNQDVGLHTLVRVPVEPQGMIGTCLHHVVDIRAECDLSVCALALHRHLDC